MFVGHAVSHGELPHVASPGFPQGSGAFSTSKKTFGVNGSSHNKAKPPAHGVISATEANQRLWDVTTEYERLLRFQGELHVLSKQHQAAELTHLQHIQGTLTGTLGDREAAAARIRAKTEEASAAQAVRLVELEFFAALGVARQRQVSDLRRMCESMYARLEQLVPAEGGRGSAERMRGRAACLEARLVARQGDVQQLAAASEATSRRIEDSMEAVAVAERERESLVEAARQQAEAARRQAYAGARLSPVLAPAADVGTKVTETQLQLAGAGRTLEEMADSSAWAHNSLPFEFSDFVDSKSDAAAEDVDVSALQLAPTTRSETIQASYAEPLVAIDEHDLGRSESRLKSCPRIAAGVVALDIPDQQFSPVGAPHTFLWHTPQNSQGSTPRMLSGTMKELSTSGSNALPDSEILSKSRSPACHGTPHDSQALASPPAGSSPVETWRQSPLGCTTEPSGELSLHHQIPSRLGLPSEEHTVEEDVAVFAPDVRGGAHNIASAYSTSSRVESPWQSASDGHNDRSAMELSPPVQHRRLHEWSGSQQAMDLDLFARRGSRQWSHANDPATQHRQAELLAETGHAARQLRAEPLSEPGHADAWRASVTWPSPIGSPVRPIGASITDDGVLFVKDEGGPPRLAAAGDNGAGSPVAVPPVAVLSDEETVDAALQDFLAQPRNRLRRALFHRLGAGEYLYGARRARLRLEPSTGQLEAADRGSAWEPIEEFARRAEKSQSARLRKARERGSSGAM